MNLIIPKNFDQKSNEEKVNFFKKQQLFLVIAYIIFAIAFSLIVYKYFDVTRIKITNYELIYDNLTELEENIVDSLMQEVNPEYLVGQKTITFTHDLKKHYNDFFNRVDDDLLGFNQNRKIVIKYNNNYHGMKRTLCHELLHTYLLPDETTHEIVYDLAAQFPCYKEKK